MTEHVAKFRPSGAANWRACPQWVGREGTSEAADEGTLLHERVYQALTGDVLGATKGLDPEQCDAVEFAFEAVHDIPGTERYYEQRWPLTPVTGEHDAFGTCDVAVFNQEANRLTVADHKFGRVEVVAEDNAQLMMYAAAICCELGLYDPELEIELLIIQPRLHRVSRALIDMAELTRFAVDIGHAVERYGKEPANPGPSQCKYCAQAGTCEALSKAVFNSVVDDFPVIESDRLMTQLQNAVDIIPEVDPSHLARMLSAAPLVEQWLSGVHARAQSLMESGVELPGFKLVAGRQGIRKWSDEKAAEDFLRQHLEDSQVFETKVVSPTKAERLLQKDARATLNDHVERAPAKPQIAPASDKRPAIDVTPLFQKDSENE